jgi:hypothetical protein
MEECRIDWKIIIKRFPLCLISYLFVQNIVVQYIMPKFLFLRAAEQGKKMFCISCPLSL